MMDFLTDQQVGQIQQVIVDKMIKKIEKCDIDIDEIMTKEVESIIEIAFQECELEPVQSLITNFLTSKLEKALK